MSGTAGGVGTRTGAADGAVAWHALYVADALATAGVDREDRKSTRLNSSH